MIAQDFCFYLVFVTSWLCLKEVSSRWCIYNYTQLEQISNRDDEELILPTFDSNKMILGKGLEMPNTPLILWKKIGYLLIWYQIDEMGKAHFSFY